MKIIHNANPFFHVSLENIFPEKTFNILYNEINSFKNKFKSEEYTGAASLLNGKLLKKNTGIFLGQLNDYEDLQTIKEIKKILLKISTDRNWKYLTFKRIFDSLIWGGELVNYYENNDYYKLHTDEGVFSLIIWMHHKKSFFNGGDLYFPEYDYLHKCKNNNGILFFSKELHEVTPISSCEKDFGRYSIVSFSRLGYQNKNLKNYISNLVYQ